MYLPTNRVWSKRIAIVLIIMGFLFASPPGIPPPDDFLNIGLATFLNVFFGVDFTIAIILTYTVIGWGLIYLGALVYPHNTTRILNGKKNQMLMILRKTFTNPYWFGMFAISVVFLWISMLWYAQFLTSATSLLIGGGA